MAQNPERETPVTPEDVGKKPEQAAGPAQIEREGAVTTPSPTTAQTSDDTSAQDDQAQANQGVSIQIPTSQDQLEDWSHGAPTNALTWFAAFWLRLIKKALHFGWRIIGRVKPKSKD